MITLTKFIKDYAHYNVDTGTLELSSRYKEIKPRQMKEFLITILHEIRHAMDAKKYGWRKFKEMYEMEMNMISQGHYPGKDDPYKDNKYEIEAENFGVKNMTKWKSYYDFSLRFFIVFGVLNTNMMILHVCLILLHLLPLMWLICDLGYHLFYSDN